MALPPPKATAWERGELAQVSWDAPIRTADRAEALNGQIGIVKRIIQISGRCIVTLFFPREQLSIERQFLPADLLRVGAMVPAWPPHLDYLGPAQDADLGDA